MIYYFATIDTATCFWGIMDNQVFWDAIGTFLTLILAYAALKPIYQRAQFEKSLFSNAVQVNVTPDGILSIHNIFTKPIKIDSVSQVLIKGSDTGLQKDADPATIQRTINKLALYRNVKKSDTIKLNKALAPDLSFLLSSSKTFLPDSLEAESIWFVTSKVIYSSSNNKATRIAEYTHRISIVLDPVNAWVEIVPSIKIINGRKNDNSI